MLREISEQTRLAGASVTTRRALPSTIATRRGLSCNPVLLDLFVGMQTPGLRVEQLGIVLPANNPIRVAGEIAMLDPDDRRP
jgi:alkanesulfonate monooxygenase SsuD/methylene tetrahydromethanopterin reductase-like flavin-dependent oxidoreductase (luciferase family)